MSDCSRISDSETLDAPHICPHCEGTIHDISIGVFLPDEIDLSRNVICFDCAEHNTTLTASIPHIPFMRQLPTHKIPKTTSTKVAPNKKRPAATTANTRSKKKARATRAKTATNRTGPKILQIPRQQTYDFEELSHCSNQSGFLYVVDLPALPQPIVICIPDSANKESNTEKDKDTKLSSEPTPIKTYDFTIPKDVPPDFDEIANVLRICERTGLPRSTKLDPDPHYWDHINKMCINLVYSLAGATVSQTIPRIDPFSHHAILSSQANHIVNNLPLKKCFIEGFLQYVYPTGDDNGNSHSLMKLMPTTGSTIVSKNM